MTSSTPPVAGSAEPAPDGEIGLAALAKARPPAGTGKAPSSRSGAAASPRSRPDDQPGRAAVDERSAGSTKATTPNDADGSGKRKHGKKGSKPPKPGRPDRRPDPAGAKPERSGRRRPPSRRPETPFWKYGFPVLLLLLVLAIPALMFTGWNLILQSKEGTFEVGNRDETQPGYSAITPPTPTMLLQQVDETGKLSGLTALAQTGDRVGGVLFIPVTTSPGTGKIPLDKVFADGGQPALTAAVQEMLGAGMGEVQVIDANQWTSLLGNVGSLQFTNPEAVDVPGVGLFPKGPIVLEPSAVGGYLATPSSSGDDLNRLRRNDAFWHAFLTKLNGSGSALPGEAEKGLTHFLPGLAQAQVAVETLPVRQVPTPDRKGNIYLPDPEAMQALTAKFIPFPTEATPGGRAKTRILDGTGRLKHGVGAAPALVKAGAQITGIGNAKTFDYPITQIIYYDDAQKEAADKMRLALGVGELAKSNDQTHDVDITVILGNDYAARPVSNDTVITSPPSVVGTVTVPVDGGNKGG